jgi:hypothetical protein
MEVKAGLQELWYEWIDSGKLKLSGCSSPPPKGREGSLVKRHLKMLGAFGPRFPTYEDDVSCYSGGRNHTER